MFDYILPAVALGFLLDLIFGDPVWLYHPVRIIGKLITLFEKLLRRLFPDTRAGQRTAGVFLVLLSRGSARRFRRWSCTGCIRFRYGPGLLLRLSGVTSYWPSKR